MLSLGMIEVQPVRPPALFEVDREYLDIFKSTQPIALESWAGGKRRAIKAKILEVRPDQLILILDPDEGNQFDLPRLSPLTIGYTAAGSLYSGESEVVAVQKTSPVRVVIARPEKIGRTQLRAAFRWETLLEDCALYRFSHSDPNDWVEFPCVVTDVSTGGVRADATAELPLSAEAEGFGYVCEIGLPWGMGVLTLPVRVLAAEKVETKGEPRWTYRCQFVDPPGASQDLIARFINRCQTEMRPQGEAPFKSLEGARRGAPAAISEFQIVARAAGVAAAGRDLPLEEALADFSRPARERAYHLQSSAAAIARDIMLSPSPENARRAAPFVAQMVDHVVRDPELLKVLVRSLAGVRDLHVHSVNVAVYAMALGLSLGHRETGNLPELVTGAFLHDLGKASIPEAILGKASELTYAEWELVSEHSSSGRSLAARAGICSPVVLDVIQHHHEKFDGSGYPDRLEGTGISVGARVVAIADGFDALTGARPWRPRYSVFKALAIMRDHMHGAYDRELLRTFVRTLGSLLGG